MNKNKYSVYAQFRLFRSDKPLSGIKVRYHIVNLNTCSVCEQGTIGLFSFLKIAFCAKCLGKLTDTF